MSVEAAPYRSNLARRITPAMDDLRENCAQSAGLTALLLEMILAFLTRLVFRLDGIAADWEAGLLLPPPPPAPRLRRAKARRRPPARRQRSYADTQIAPAVPPSQARITRAAYATTAITPISRQPLPKPAFFSKSRFRERPTHAHFIPLSK